MTQSCAGCKYLYGDGQGYSTWTWLETFARCALGKNPNLARSGSEDCGSVPWNNGEPMPPNWPPIATSRCDSYSPGEFITLDPDREDKIESLTDDPEQIAAIKRSDGQIE